MLKRIVRRLLGRPSPKPGLKVEWFKKAADSWLAKKFPASQPAVFPPVSNAQQIEERIAITGQQGERPLWEGYQRKAACRGDEIRTSPKMGNFLYWLCVERRPGVLVEFGTAFGSSGMYWLSGLNANGGGKLFTFEPNKAWADLARENLKAVSDRFELTVGTFEDNVDTVLKGRKIDLAFIDAIHTSEFVIPQFDIVLKHLAPKGLVVLDDLNYSDDMLQCWRQRVAQDPRVKSSLAIADQFGVVEID